MPSIIHEKTAATVLIAASPKYTRIAALLREAHRRTAGVASRQGSGLMAATFFFCEWLSLPHAQHTTTRASPQQVRVIVVVVVVGCASGERRRRGGKGGAGGGDTDRGVCVLARACGNRGALLFFFKWSKSLGGDGTTEGCVMGARSCGCTGRSVHHQTQMRLDVLLVKTGLYVIVESHRASRVHLRRGRGGAVLPSPVIYKRFGEGWGPLFSLAKAVTGGGDCGAAGGARRGVHYEGSFIRKHRCDSTFYRGGTARPRVSNRIWRSVPPHDGGGARCVVASSRRPPRERCPLFWFSLLAKCVVTAPAGGGDAAGCCGIGACQHSDATRLSVGGGVCLTLCPVASGVACHPTTERGVRCVDASFARPPPEDEGGRVAVFGFGFWANVLSPLPPPPTRWGACATFSDGCLKPKYRVDVSIAGGSVLVPLSSRIRSRVSPHDCGGVRCVGPVIPRRPKGGEGAPLFWFLFWQSVLSPTTAGGDAAGCCAAQGKSGEEDSSPTFYLRGGSVS